MTLSLRARLAAAIVGVAGVAAAVLAALLYAAVAAVLWADLDRELGETAAIFGELVEWEPEDGYELEGGEAIARQLAAGARSRMVTVRAPGGAPLLGAPPADPDLGAMPEGAVFELAAEGRALRGVRLVVAPRSEGPPAPGPVEIVVLADTAGTRATLGEIAAWCWLLAAGTIALAALASLVAAGRGLAPVRRLARALDRIGGHDDALALTAEEVPAELRVIVREISAVVGFELMVIKAPDGPYRETLGRSGPPLVSVTTICAF